MKFFKHGDAVAIVLPEPLQKASEVKDGDEYEFFQIEPGVFLLMSRSKIEESSKRDALVKLAQKVLPASPAYSPANSNVPSIPVSSSSVSSKQLASSSSSASSASHSYSYSSQRFKPGSPESLLQQNGFVVLDNEAQAKQLHSALEKSIKTGLVRGTRGFDKKYYIIHSSLYDSIAPRIIRCLEAKKESSFDEIVSSSNAAPQAVLAVLNLMKEDGDLLEKRRGLYALVR